MTGEAPTWLVLERDVSESVEIKGQRRTELALVLDADNGLVVATVVGTSAGDVIRRALKDALVRPAPPLKKAVPHRLVTAPDLVDHVQSAVGVLSKLATADLVEGMEMWEAEEVFDSLVGHMEGRAQPGDPPSVADWHLVYDAMSRYADAAPWERWSDSECFDMRLDIGNGEWLGRSAVVLGAAGIQRGLNVLLDHAHLAKFEELAERNDPGANPLEVLEASLIVHLDPWRDTHGLAAVKARRFGWASHARLVPSLFTVRDGGPADLSGDDARLLALATHALLAQDAKSLSVVGGPPETGTIQFGDGVAGRFEVARP